jgi:hypothetical protein
MQLNIKYTLQLQTLLFHRQGPDSERDSILPWSVFT